MKVSQNSDEEAIKNLKALSSETLDAIVEQLTALKAANEESKKTVSDLDGKSFRVEMLFKDVLSFFIPN